MPRLFDKSFTGRVFPGWQALLWIAVLASLGIGLQCGCQQGDQGADKQAATTDNAPLSGPTASEIIRQVTATYQSAETYQDQATLNLSYQLLGSYLEEPHAWDVRFSRDTGIRIDAYEARIRGNQNQLGCYVFDFGSGNLDNQCLLLPAEGTTWPLEDLFADGICRHYITGRDEVPVNTNHGTLVDCFFPPTVSLLTGQLLPSWLAEGSPSRRANAKIDGHECFIVQLEHQGMTWTMSIDCRTSLIREIRYPNELLDQRLQNNPEVKNLEVVARFRSPVTNSSLATDNFDLTPPNEAKIVRQFVAVPEPFPSSRIGQKIEDLELRDAADQLLEQSAWQGKTTVLCWINDCPDHEAMLAGMEQVMNEQPAGQVQIVRVEVIEGVLPGNAAVAEQLTDLQQQGSIPVWADYGFHAGRKLGLDHFPMLALIDGNGTLQFVRSMRQEPVGPETLVGLINRVRDGDDIAREMRAEYESFLDLYQERLATAMNRTQSSQTVSAATQPSRVQLNLLWTRSDFQQPGNLGHASAQPGGPVTLLDGWRTVLQVDVQGNEVKRKELDLDSRESISVVRTGDQQPGLRVVYSIMGTTVWVLNDDLTTIKTAEVQNEQQKIRDAYLFDFDNDGADELVVSFTGPRGTELIEISESSSARRISDQSFRSTGMLRHADGTRTLVYCDAEGELGQAKFGSGSPGKITTDLVTAVQVFVAGEPNQAARICAIGTDQQGNWLAVGLDTRFQQIWAHPIGSQRFETQIESVTYAPAREAGYGYWCIAGADGSITLVSGDGQQTDRWNPGLDLRGIELLPADSGYRLLISSSKQLHAWDLQVNPGANRSAAISDEAAQ